MTRRLTLIVLAASLVAFAGMVILVSVGVLSRRRDRDFKFGLEQLDVLIADGGLQESSAMIPWLAERADEAGEMLSVLKRGVEILDAGGGPEPLDRAALTAVRAFPGNETIRAIGVYAAVLAGDTARALEWGREHLLDTNPDMFAWLILKTGQIPPTRDGDLSGGLFLSQLGGDSSAADLERAWRTTRDWRYAADAASMRMAEGAMALAVETASGASLSLYAPILAADIYSDAGDHESALIALRNAPKGDPAIRIRMADALMGLGRYDEASRLYTELRTEAPLISEVPYLNLAWLADAPDSALDAYDAAVDAFPGSWTAVEQRALAIAQTDVRAAFDSLSDYTGPAGGDHETLLRLRLAPRLEELPFEGQLWRLVNSPDAPEEARRFAAWYFAGKRDFASVAEILDGPGGDSSWVWTYRGLLSVEAARFSEAAAAFEKAYLSDPSWVTALNLALASFASGRTSEGLVALDSAGDHARRSGFPTASASVFVAAARVHSDRSLAQEAAATALQIDPVNTRALLLRSQLESARTY